jgi:hypothetical protein
LILKFEAGFFQSASSMRDVAIAYRICPKVADAVLGLPFREDKLELSEVCLRSLKESLGSLRIKLWALLDGCPPEYEQLFRKYFDDHDLVLVSLPSVGNQATFAKQMELLLEQQESEIVYFAEDDYFYLPDQFRSMTDFLLQHEDVHFVSPYDHLDYYTMALHRTPERCMIYSGRRWRTAASTCLTFLTRRETLAKTKVVFRNYKRRSFDCSMWISLTGKRVFNPFFFASSLFREPFSSKLVLKSWLYFWPQLLFGQKWNLWVPVPAIATHLDANSLSPNADWLAMMQQTKETIRGRVPAAK